MIVACMGKPTKIEHALYSQIYHQALKANCFISDWLLKSVKKYYLFILISYHSVVMKFEFEVLRYRCKAVYLVHAGYFGYKSNY